MNSVNLESFTEELDLSAYGVLQLIKDELRPMQISICDEEQWIIDALNWHGAHLDEIRIFQSNLDPFKLVCWLGGSIIRLLEDDESRFQHEQIVSAVIQVLKLLLFLETRRKASISSVDTDLLQRMLLAEINGLGRHGIGFNGLFIAFHLARSVCDRIQTNV